MELVAEENLRYPKTAGYEDRNAVDMNVCGTGFAASTLHSDINMAGMGKRPTGLVKARL